MPDAWNALHALNYARGKESIAKTWWHLDHANPATARALGIDKADPCATYALIPFRYFRDPDSQRHLVLAAWPCPAVLSVDGDGEDWDWLGIEQIVAWDPVTDKATIHGDPSPQLFASMRDDARALFTSPRQFFQAWARRRAAFLTMWQDAAKRPWDVQPRERDEVPGALLIGQPEQVRWNLHTLPETIDCVGIDPLRVNRAILKAARLPRAVNAQNMKVAA